MNVLYNTMRKIVCESVCAISPGK